jgi:signal transduction histidine kinase
MARDDLVLVEGGIGVMAGNRNPWTWLSRQLLSRRHTVLTVVLLVGVLLSAGAFLDGWRRTRLEVDEVFRSDAAEHFGTLREEMEEAVDGTASVATFLQTVGTVDRQTFREFVLPHLTRCQELLAIVWVPRVPDNGRARFEATGRRVWGSGFRIFDPGTQDQATGQRAEYFPVYYRESIAPLDNSRFVGEDLGAIPASLEALRRAQETGQPAMTPILRLITGEMGVHVYWPIFGRGAPYRTVEQRQENLQGFVGGILQIEEIAKSSLELLSPRGIEITLSDEGAQGVEKVFYHHPSGHEYPFRPWFWQRLAGDWLHRGMRWTGTLDVGGRRWAVSLEPTAGYISARVGSNMWATLLLGLLTTGLVGGYLLLLMRRTDEVERLVAARTQELRNAHDRLLGEVAERTRAETAAQRHSAQLEAIRTVSLEVTREMGLDKVLTLVSRQAGDLLRAGTSTVWLWDEAGEVLVPRAHHGPGEWSHAARLRRGEGVVGTVATKAQGLLVNDYRNSAYALPFFLECTRTTAVVAEPLLFRERLLGVLSVDNDGTGRPFSDEDSRILALFAAQAASSIHTAQLFDEVAGRREQARRLTQQVLSVQEEERRRLSRELHDDAGQSLTTLVLDLRLLYSDVPDAQASLRHRLREAGVRAQALTERIRLVARDLRPPALDTIGLSASLEDLCHEIGRRTGLSVAYSGAEVASLPDAITICLYRVLQEALTNVVKHARASRVQVALQNHSERVILSIEDDGQGFDTQPAMVPHSSSRGVGLLGMRERLELLGGRLEIISGLGEGTCLVAWVPAMTEEPSLALAGGAITPRG